LIYWAKKNIAYSSKSSLAWYTLPGSGKMISHRVAYQRGAP